MRVVCCSLSPFPAARRVVPGSLSGCFERAQIMPGQIVFFVSRDRSGSIRYQLEGVLPGSNLISPTTLRFVGCDAPLAVAKPKSLVVLPQGSRSADPYRLSPDELLALGAIAKGRGDVAGATRYYTELLESWHNQPGFGLSDAAYHQTIFALMELGMSRAAPAKLVQYCEIIKEKWPTDPVTLDQLLTAAGAYRQIGELERSYMACRAAVEGSFTRESGVAGFLDKQGEFLRSVGHMGRLLRDYPPEPYVAEAEMELAQRVYAKAGEVQSTASPTQSPTCSRPCKLQREALIARAWQKLDSFLAGFPTDAAADQAAFAAANALLDLKRYADAGQAAGDYARRYPKSDLLDSYWYIMAYCDFAAGRHASAIDMCRKVAQAQHLDKESGRMVDSPNKNRAIYILGQIYQSLGQRGNAIREYRRVEDRIADAKSSASYFLRKQISLPNCTTLQPGKAAEVELGFRNISACHVNVYRVDLMKFCEAAQAQGDLSQVNLAGIRPLYADTVALVGGKDYCDHMQKLALPLKKEGAYLVVCRGDDLYASGLVLISPLEIESRFDSVAGQIRVFVKDASTGQYVGDAQIRIMPRLGLGVANLTGTTDFRGVFAGNCPAVAATIVAQAAGGRYAYFATLPPASDTRGAVAAAERAEDDPTAPFMRERRPEDAGLTALIRQQAAAEGLRRPVRSTGQPLPVPQTASLERPSSTVLSGDESPAERKIREALNQPTQIEFVETPLKDVIDYLKDLHHIEIQLDTSALKEAGVDEAAPVTKNLKGLTLRSALKLMLDELQLKWVIHNEVLLVTTPAKAESDEYMVTKVYPVNDLVLPVGADPSKINAQPLEDLLTNNVATKTWSDNGGTGTLSHIIVGNRVLLVLSQTQEVHDQVEDMLAMLRKAGGLKAVGQDGNGNMALSQSQSPFVISVIPVIGGGTAPNAPAMHLQPRPTGGMGGMGGGMGNGMGGNMGGGMGGMSAAAPGGDADLLGGLKSANEANQNAKVQHLKQRQEAGQGGTGGGMGGGFF